MNYDVPFSTFNIFTIRSISRNIHILHSTKCSIRFAYFYVFPPKCPSGSPQTSLVTVTGANGSGRAVTGCLACCRWFCFSLLAWNMPRGHCHRALGYLWRTVPARCLDHGREGRLSMVLGEKRVLGWSCRPQALRPFVRRRK